MISNYVLLILNNFILKGEYLMEDILNPMNNHVDLKSIHELNPYCILCGSPVNFKGNQFHTWNVEHLFPRVLVNWGGCPAELIAKHANTAIVHPNCNYSKGCQIPSVKHIDRWHTTQGHKNKLLELRTQLQPYIDKYFTTVRNVYARQHHLCHYCGRRMDIWDVIIRRKDKDKERTEDNAVLLCYTCCRKWSGVREHGKK